MNTRPIFKVYVVVLTLLVTASIVTACSGGAASQFQDIPVQDIPDIIDICHATGDAANPYVALTLGLNELSTHSEHPDDIIPAPAEGCPSEVAVNGNDGQITICHATGSASNPYTKIAIAFSGLSGHAKHENDFILEPETAECPTTTATPVGSATPTVTGTVTATMTATPEGTSTPEATPGSDQGDTITICHATGSSTNPYVMITVSVNGLNGHGKHKNDIIPAPEGGCP